jgi:multisubunit Na+/H+ antiporter MnhF subunit
VNLAHLHLITNHIPVIGLPIAVVLLIFGLWRKERALTSAALWLTVLVALGTIPAYASGDGAHHLVEQEPGVRHELIHEHEDAADIAFTLLEITGGLALLVLIFQSRQAALATKGAIVVVVLGIVVSAAMARVAELGGVIRHVEIRTDGLTKMLDPAAAADTSNTIQERHLPRMRAADSTKPDSD